MHIRYNQSRVLSFDNDSLICLKFIILGNAHLNPNHSSGIPDSGKPLCTKTNEFRQHTGT